MHKSSSPKIRINYRIIFLILHILIRVNNFSRRAWLTHQIICIIVIRKDTSAYEDLSKKRIFIQYFYTMYLNSNLIYFPNLHTILCASKIRETAKTTFVNFHSSPILQ